MNIWMLMIVIGGLTLVGRMSFLVLFGQRDMPAWAKTALRYVPVTALTALAMPGVILNDSTIDLSLNPRTLAALVAVLVAWKTQNILATITAGMLVFWITRFLIGL